MEKFEANDKDKVAGLLEDCRDETGKITWTRDEKIYVRSKPNILYNAMMHPLIPYACRGIAWYQGERNTHSLQDMLQYETSLKTWFSYLKAAWGKDDFYLMAVMLPQFNRIQKGGESMEPTHPGAVSWAFMHESMWKLQQMPHTAVVNTIDLGDPNDIHPKDKEPIGVRLALLACSLIHNADGLAQGPVFKKAAFKKGKVEISFHFSDGLTTTDGNPPKAFWIAGEEKKWYRAKAVIKGERVILSSEKVKKPLEVRYAFVGTPDVNLINQAGLPAVPFRTDDRNP